MRERKQYKKIVYFSPGYFHAREGLFIEISKHFNIKVIDISHKKINGSPSENYLRNVKNEIWDFNSAKLKRINKESIPRLFWKIFIELKKNNYDIVITSTQHTLHSKIVAFYRPFFKFKLAYVNEAWIYFPKKSFLDRAYEKLAVCMVRKADFVLNEGIRSEEFMLSLGLPKARCLFWPMMSEDLMLKPIAINKYLEGLLEFKENSINFAYVGRFSKSKGVFTLLDAFIFLLNKSHFNNVFMYLVGGGYEIVKVREIAKKFSNIIVIEWVTPAELPFIYSRMDFFVNPSHYDGFSTVACEAASMSLPLILTKMVGCVPDLLVDNDNGFVVEAKSSTELAKAIERIVEVGKEKRLQMGYQSRMKFLEMSSFQHHINSINLMLNE